MTMMAHNHAAVVADAGVVADAAEPWSDPPAVGRGVAGPTPPPGSVGWSAPGLRRWVGRLVGAPGYTGFLAWTTGRVLAGLGAQLLQGSRTVLLGLCEATAPSLRGLFEEYEAGFWGQVFLFDEYGVHHHHLSPGGVVVDVGANVGFFSWKVKAHQPSAQVYAFEPEPTNLAKLRRVFEALEIQGEVVGAALSDREGRALLHLRNSVTHSLVAEHQPELDRGGSVHVPLLTLDDFRKARWPSLERVELLKIDVEGAEADVLQGATATLAATQAVTLEYHSAALGRRCRVLLEEAGFTCATRSYWGAPDAEEGLLFAWRPSPSRRLPGPGFEAQGRAEGRRGWALGVLGQWAGITSTVTPARGEAARPHPMRRGALPSGATGPRGRRLGEGASSWDARRRSRAARRAGQRPRPAHPGPW